MKEKVPACASESAYGVEWRPNGATSAAHLNIFCGRVCALDVLAGFVRMKEPERTEGYGQQPHLAATVCQAGSRLFAIPLYTPLASRLLEQIVPGGSDAAVRLRDRSLGGDQVALGRAPDDSRDGTVK